MTRVLVIGAGVIGLSCAVRLAENGHEVAVLARDLPEETTSSVAAALWHPYRAWPADRVDAWGRATYRELARLAEAAPESGVRMRHGTELFRATPSGPGAAPETPDWTAELADFARVPNPRDGYAEAWRFTAPVVDMGDYLPWLATRLTRLGGTLTRRAFGSLPDTAEVVVNAAGLGARHLAGDDALSPVRGQVVVVEQTGVRNWTLDPSDPDAPVHVIPRLRSVVIGGTAEVGDWNPAPAPTTAERLLRAADRLVPGIGDATVLRHRVGLRPGRPAVRLDAERLPRSTGGERFVVHCYGHGGSGVTVSWGCADEVAALVEAR